MEWCLSGWGTKRLSSRAPLNPIASTSWSRFWEMQGWQVLKAIPQFFILTNLKVIRSQSFWEHLKNWFLFCSGRISMEEAEKLKLKREAAELGMDNIISTEGPKAASVLATAWQRTEFITYCNHINNFSVLGRSRRNVFSVYSTNEYKPVPKEGPEVPLKEQLSKLKNIVDSEDDSDWFLAACSMTVFCWYFFHIS